MNEIDSTKIFGVFKLFVIIAFVIVGCMGGGQFVSEYIANMILLGTEVQTTDEYEQIFNDSFTGYVIEKNKCMYTVRNVNGTERIVDRYWLELRNVIKINYECNRSDEL